MAKGPPAHKPGAHSTDGSDTGGDDDQQSKISGKDKTKSKTLDNKRSTKGDYDKTIKNKPTNGKRKIQSDFDTVRGKFENDQGKTLVNHPKLSDYVGHGYQSRRAFYDAVSEIIKETESKIPQGDSGTLPASSSESDKTTTAPTKGGCSKPSSVCIGAGMDTFVEETRETSTESEYVQQGNVVIIGTTENPPLEPAMGGMIPIPQIIVHEPIEDLCRPFKLVMNDEKACSALASEDHDEGPAGQKFRVRRRPRTCGEVATSSLSMSEFPPSLDDDFATLLRLETPHREEYIIDPMDIAMQTYADEMGSNYHTHALNYGGCPHFSGYTLQCDGGEGDLCLSNQIQAYPGICFECAPQDGSGGFKRTVKRIGNWFASTAGRITHRKRAGVRTAFSGSGGAGASSGIAGGEGGGGRGSGLGHGRGDGTRSETPSPERREREREVRRKPSRFIRRQTGSSVGAGGFDPTCQEDTESDKS